MKSKPHWYNSVTQFLNKYSGLHEAYFCAEEDDLGFDLSIDYFINKYDQLDYVSEIGNNCSFIGPTKEFMVNDEMKPLP